MNTSGATTRRLATPPSRGRLWRSNRREDLPRVRLFGGDPVLGGDPPAIGHAGRSRLSIGLVAAVLAFACILMALLPQRAEALSESMSFYKNPVDYTMSVSSYRSADGDVAYCCNKTLPHENGRVYTSSEFATGRWGYVTYHGYPTTTVIEGTPLSVGRARSATQWAVWMLNGDDVESDPYFTGAAADMRMAAYALRDAALAYERSGVDGPENHFARIYYPPSGALQNFLAVPGGGSVEVKKVSANESATEGNPCYSLEGAVFELFSDEACSELVAEATTNSEGIADFGSVTAGTYWVREKTAPAGYALDATPRQVDAASPAGVVEFADKPQRYAVGLLAKKLDADTGEAVPQGNASLAGAEFTVRHYPALLSKDELASATADATWIVASNDTGEVWLDDQHLIGGDSLPKAADGTTALPLGTITVEETKPPVGYLLPSTGPAVIQLPSSGDDELLTLSGTPTFEEEVARGGLSLAKRDRETLGTLPLGMARLEGAVFSVENASDEPVVVAGETYDPGMVVTTLTTNRNGAAETASDLLPFGAYIIRETQAPEGYLPDTEWSKQVVVDSQGCMADAFSEGESATNQVKRGDFSFSKVDGDTMARLAGIAFRVTLLEDAYGERIGESHIIVTDENGLFDSSAMVIPHTEATNANDDAVSDEGRVDKSRLAPSAGVWFSGRNLLTTTPDDGLGALPYGTYLLEELRSDANEGHSLVRIKFTVRGHGRTLDLGTLDDNPLGIQTTLESADGSPVVAANGLVTLVDTIDYRGLTPGESYRMAGTLHRRSADGNDMGELVDDDGAVITAAAEFVPTESSGSTQVVFEFDASGLEGSTVVAFEECLENGQVVARHEDIACESQTVRFAGIATTAADASDGDHIIAPDKTATIVDTVFYQGLVPGETYQVSGTLHLRGDDGSDQGALRDASGRVVTATTTFTPTEESGTVEVMFELDASSLDDRTIVVFEQLSCAGELRATHEDISDEAQTIHVSKHEPVVPPAPTSPSRTPQTPVMGDQTSRTKPLFTFLAGLITMVGGVGAAVIGRLRPSLGKRRPPERTTFPRHQEACLRS